MKTSKLNSKRIDCENPSCSLSPKAATITVWWLDAGEQKYKVPLKLRETAADCFRDPDGEWNEYTNKLFYIIDAVCH